MKTVRVRGIGFGSAYNSYRVDFTFEVADYLTEDEIRAKALRLLKDKSACTTVSITSIEVVTTIS
jgi:hypothetical protein